MEEIRSDYDVHRARTDEPIRFALDALIIVNNIEIQLAICMMLILSFSALPRFLRGPAGAIIAIRANKLTHLFSIVPVSFCSAPSEASDS